MKTGNQLRITVYSFESINSLIYMLPLSVYSSPLRNKTALALPLSDLAVTCNKWCLNDPKETSVQTVLSETWNF